MLVLAKDFVPDTGVWKKFIVVAVEGNVRVSYSSWEIHWADSSVYEPCWASRTWLCWFWDMREAICNSP